MSRRSLLPLLLAVLPATLSAQGGLTPEQAVGMRQLTNVRISPDGQRVAYTVTVQDLAENTVNADLWMVPTAGGVPVRLTNHKAMDDRAGWSPDGRSLAFVSAREGAAQLFRLSLAGGEPVQLTRSKTPVQAFAWSPDGQRIAYVAARVPTPEEETRQKLKDDRVRVDLEFVPSRLFILDLGRDTTLEVVAEDYQINDLAWSPDGRHIAYEMVPTPRADDMRLADIRVLDVAAGTNRLLYEHHGSKTDPSWSPDGRWIAFSVNGAARYSLSQSRLAVIPATGGTPRFLGEGFAHVAGGTVWSPDGQSLLFWAQTRTRPELYRQSLAGGLPTKLSDIQGAAGLWGAGTPSLSSDGTVIAFPRSTVTAPDEVHVARLDRAWQHVALTSLNPELATVTMGKGEVMRWKGKDGMEIEGVVVYPAGYEAGKRYPTVSIIHGGPSGVWDEGFAATWYNPAQVFAGAGWVVLLPNVRGSSGYGEKHLAANYQDWGRGDFQDIMTGLDELVRRGIADPARMVQTGWSYGGYLTAWALTQTNRFKAVMVGAGLTNLYSMYGTNDLQRVLEDYFGGTPYDVEPQYRRASAMTFIKQARTPTLILHGQQDTRVPIGQAQELYMGLVKQGVPVELVFYPRQGHGLMEPRHQLDKIRRELEYFAKHAAAAP